VVVEQSGFVRVVPLIGPETVAINTHQITLGYLLLNSLPRSTGLDEGRHFRDLCGRVSMMEVHHIVRIRLPTLYTRKGFFQGLNFAVPFMTSFLVGFNYLLGVLLPMGFPVLLKVLLVFGIVPLVLLSNLFLVGSIVIPTGPPFTLFTIGPNLNFTAPSVRTKLLQLFRLLTSSTNFSHGYSFTRMSSAKRSITC
jgi:hypothetical protein